MLDFTSLITFSDEHISVYLQSFLAVNMNWSNLSLQSYILPFLFYVLVSPISVDSVLEFATERYDT